MSAEQSGIEKYRKIAELGQGGMANVFLALKAGPAGFNKLLVIKQLRSVEDPTMVAMFLDDARLAAQISHPNVVETHEVVHSVEKTKHLWCLSSLMVRRSHGCVERQKRRVNRFP
jgi:eukaryotic-like serine/threonine-protein kinase